MSFFIISDGKNYKKFGTAQDHKRVGEYDTGPTTGGMGAYSPAPVVDAQLHDRIMAEVIRPTVDGMQADGYEYSGFLYAGIMVTADGIPKGLEFNCRFGDPETHPIMLRLKSIIVDWCLAAERKELDQSEAEWDPRAAVGVVLAAGGYPDSYPKGDVISLPASTASGSKIFHAGTATNDGQVGTNGGRVLCATALGNTVTEAQHAAYALVAQISWPDMYCRRDIGHRAIGREQS